MKIFSIYIIQVLLYNLNVKIIKFLVLIWLILFLAVPFKPALAQRNDSINFYLKDLKTGAKVTLKLGRGKLENYPYEFLKKDNAYKLKLGGKGAVNFSIVFKNSSLVFPKEGEVLSSPLVVLNTSKKTLMFCVSPYDKNFWTIKNRGNNVYIVYNLYLKDNREIDFRIEEVDGVRGAIERYKNLYRTGEPRIKEGGTLYPDGSLTKLRNAGIYDFNLKFRIIDPLNENAITSIFESQYFNIQSFLLFNPFKYSVVTKDKVSLKDLYFSKDYVKKNFAIAISTSGVRDSDNKILKIIKEAEPTLRIEKVIKGKSVTVNEVPDMREGMVENIFPLCPDKNYLKNMLLSAYDISYFYNIFYTDISINAENRKRNLAKDEECNYVGYAIDLTDISEIYDYELSHSKEENLVFIDGKPSIYFPFEILSFIEEEKKNGLIMTINPTIFQIGFNSDIIVKEINNLSYLEDLPPIRAIFNNRTLILSLSMPTEEINRELIERFFKRCLLFGIYPTFTKHKSDPYSLWNKQDLVNMVKPYFSKYIPLIKEVNKREWKGKTFARISDGNVERFGDYPDILFTINGSGYLEIDKENLNIDDEYEVIDLETKKPLKTSEEDGKIYVKLENSQVVRVFKGKENPVLSSSFSRKKQESPFFVLFLLPIFLIPIFFKKIKIKFPSLKLTLPLTAVFLFLVRKLYFIPSPPFLFLLLSLIHFLSSFYFEDTKRKIFSLISVYFFFIFSLFVILNKGFKVNPFPPFYFPFDLYFFLIFLSMFLLITTMYKTKRRTNFFIIVLFIISFFLSDITTFPFFSPPFDKIFFITAITMGLILVAISGKSSHFIMSLGYFALLIPYLFWDKIYFYLIQHRIFLGRDILTSIIVTIFTILYIIYTEEKGFIKLPEGLYTILLLVLTTISILFHLIFIRNPLSIGIFLSIVKIVIYAFLVLFSIYIFEILFSRREE